MGAATGEFTLKQTPKAISVSDFVLVVQAVVEILLLSGGCPYANFKDLAYAWGRERNFHQAVISTVFDRRGEIQRKKRSDTGVLLTEEQKQSLRDKRPKKESSVGGENGAAHDGGDQKVGDGVDRVMKI